MRARRLISVRGVEALGHIMLDRVYPAEEPQIVSVGAAAQSETGGPEGAQVRGRSRLRTITEGRVPWPLVSLPLTRTRARPVIPAHAGCDNSGVPACARLRGWRSAHRSGAAPSPPRSRHGQARKVGLRERPHQVRLRPIQRHDDPV